MTTQQKTFGIKQALLWAAQGILALSLIWAAYMKLFQSTEKLGAMWPWTADHPFLTKFTGVIDLLAGLGLILPALLKRNPEVISYTAYGTIALMVAAGVFHIVRGEISLIVVNLVFLLMAVFIASARENRR